MAHYHNTYSIGSSTKPERRKYFHQARYLIKRHSLELPPLYQSCSDTFAVSMNETYNLPEKMGITILYKLDRLETTFAEKRSARYPASKLK